MKTAALPNLAADGDSDCTPLSLGDQEIQHRNNHSVVSVTGAAVCFAEFVACSVVATREILGCRSHDRAFEHLPLHDLWFWFSH